MRVGTSYKQHAISDRWDVIVIGSGIGGLTTASMLARHQNKRVLVLERHYTAGGFTHAFSRPGYEWDVGVHYIGEVHRPHSGMRRIFDHLTDHNLDWADMGEVCDTIVIAGDRYEFPRGAQAFAAHMKDYFPHDARAIDRYMCRVKNAAKHSRTFFLEKALPSLLANAIGFALRWPAMRDAQRTLAQVFAEVGIVPGSRLAGVLSGQLGDYGLTPKEVSFLMHAILVKHYQNGAAYPVGGSSQIARAMIPGIERNGGKVITSAAVASVLFTGNKAIGVAMADGREIFAPIIVSDAGWASTWGQLVPRELSIPFKLTGKIENVPPSLAHAALYIGANKDAATLKLKPSNIWLYPHEDHDKNLATYISNANAPLPLTYLSFPAAKDPSFATRFPGRSTIEAIGFAPFEWFSKFSHGAWKKRGDRYDSFKQDLSDRLLNALYDECPTLRTNIDYVELSTPLSTKHFTGHPHGEIYGLSHVPARFAHRALRPDTPFPGLYLTGSDICVAGVSGALMGGIIAASRIAQRNMFKIALRGSPNSSEGHRG